MPIDYTKRGGEDAGGDAGPTPGAGGLPSGPAPGGRGPVSLSKITLTKAAPSVSLSKQGGGGSLHVNLNWNARGAAAAPAKAGGGFLKRLMAAGQSGGIDLDLACLYELADGSKGVVQALGNAFGSFDRPPYARLDADDRTGAAEGGENLYVNLAHARDIRRILVFAFIYEGVAAFEAANAVVTLTPQSGAPIEVRLDESAGASRMCAIALLTNSGGNDFVVSREVRYVGGHRDLDAAYGWGLQWTPGRK